MKSNVQIVKEIKATEFTILCQTVYGEARSEETQGRMAIVHVILNRVKKHGWMGKSVEEVCLKPHQFSCWNDDDINRDKCINLSWMECEDNGIFHDVKLALNWWKVGNDVSDKSTHYHTKYVYPQWSFNKIPCVKIGDHLFYNDVE